MKVLTIGGATIDTISIVESSQIELMMMRNAESSYLLLEEGRKIEASEISTHCGGGALNTAVAASRLGCEVSTVVKIGDDGRGAMVLKRLAEEGISDRWVRRTDEAPTGASVFVSSHDSNAAIFTFRGTNGLLILHDISDDAFAVDLVHIAALSNASADLYLELICRAKRHGSLISANPGVRQLAAHSSDMLRSLEDIDILVLNRSEGDILSSHLRVRSSQAVIELNSVELPLVARGLGPDGQRLGLATFMKTVVDLGPRYVVVTDGRSGAYVGTVDAIYFCPAVSLFVVGTAGAGDAFVATFSVEIAGGQPPDQALHAATLNAAAVVQHVDTQTGLLQREVLEARLKTNIEGIIVREYDY